MEHVRTRFAPSPTGFLHIGGLRTALYSELFARHHQGTFILRVEDTDRTRLVEGAIEGLCRSLTRCGVAADEGVWIDEAGNMIEKGEYGPYLQSERKDHHRKYAEEMIEKNAAYYCFCSSERLEELRKEQEAAHQPTMYDGLCRRLSQEDAARRVSEGESYVIRLRVPHDRNMMIHDLIRGDVEFDLALIDDQVLLKSDGFPTYHLAAVCDDHDMKITHVIRGEDWIASTPKHILIYEAMGWIVPQFAHLPLLLNPDRSKLSKRQGDVAVEDYLAKGYLPAAIVNFVAMLGWNPTADREIFTKQELIELFDITKVNKSGAVFNVEKLDWLNAQYLKKMPREEYLSLVSPCLKGKTSDEPFLHRCALLVRDRLIRVNDITELTQELFVEHHDYSRVSLTWKIQATSEALERLEALRDRLVTLSEDQLLHVSEVEKEIKELIAQKGWGNGDTLWPLRVALSGAEKSPGPFELVATYGKERTLSRLEDAIAFLRM